MEEKQTMHHCSRTSHRSRTDQVKLEASPPKLEIPTFDVKEEVGEPDANEQIPDTVKEEVQDDREIQPHDSEDSLSQERVANELRRLTEIQAHATGDAPHQSSEEGATAPISEGATAPTSAWNRQGARLHVGLGESWSLCTSEIRKIPGQTTVSGPLRV